VTGASPALISQVISAKRMITPETADLLAKAFGTTAELWLGLDARYQASLVKPKKGVGAEWRARLHAKAPVRAMIRRGWISETKDLDVLEAEVLAFCEQASLDSEWVFDHAAKKSGGGAYGITSPEQYAWLCRCRQLARAVTVKSQWRESKLNDLVYELQRLTLSAPAIQDMPAVLAEFGIRLVVVERLPGMKMDGAVFWLSDGMTDPVIALSFTRNRIDNAWHTIFHEVAHIKNKDRLAVDSEVNGAEEKPEAEQMADAFAAQALVPQARLDDFVGRVFPLFSYKKVIGFSQLVNVHPGIVVGQLHKRSERGPGLSYKNLNSLCVPVREFVTDHAMTEGWGKTVPVEVGTQTQG